MKSVLITELHPKATEEDVFEMFKFCGPIKEIELLKSKSALSPTDGVLSISAIVRYIDAAPVKTALMLSRAIILGKAVQVAEYNEAPPEPLPEKIEQMSDSTNPNKPRANSASISTKSSSTLTTAVRASRASTLSDTQTSSKPTITPSAQQISPKPSSRPGTPTLSSIFSSNTSSNSSSAPLFSIFSSSPPKPPIEPAPQQPAPAPSAPLFTLFSTSPPKMNTSIEMTTIPPRSAPIPIAARPTTTKPLPIIPSISPSPSPSNNSYLSSSPASVSSTPPSLPATSPPPNSLATPSPQSTAPIATLPDTSPEQTHQEKIIEKPQDKSQDKSQDKNQDKDTAAKPKTTADDLEEMLHISEKVDTVTALATEIAHKASLEAKQFDEKYSITSKFNFLKAKAISLKNEVIEKHK